MKNINLVFIALVFLFASCQKELTGDTLNPLPYKEIKNQAYGTKADQNADFYLPANRTKTSTKVLVLLHGGSWSLGDKTDLDSFILLVKTGYPNLAIINMNYTLATTDPSTKFPAQMNDIKLMLDYISANQDSLQISNIFSLGGISAGGHLALEFAYKYDVPKRIKATGGIVPPCNFLDPYYTTNPLFQTVALNFIGQPLTDTATYKAASPAWVVTAAAPPTFLSFGGLDPLVPVSNATFMQSQLTTLNVPFQYYFYPTESHIYSNANYADVANKLVAFLKIYL